MHKILILNEAELRQLLPLNLASIDCIAQAFTKLATTAVVMPAVLRMDIEPANGEVDVKTAYMPGLDSFAIKVSPGFFNNPSLGLPSLNGLMILLSAETGLLKAMLLDNGYLTATRTAAAGAVACQLLARNNASQIAIIGAGEQAGLQLQAATMVRPITAATVWAPSLDKANSFAKQQSKLLGIPVQAHTQIDTAVQAADIIITSTPSTKPLLQLKHLRPGLHITAMGADAEHKNELDPSLIKACDLYVCDRLQQTRTLGELHHAIRQGLVDAATEYPELGQILAQQKTGRSNNTQITICDLTGTGIQDTAIAAMAYEKALHGSFGSFIQA